jgi:hypothetical protein
MLVIEYFLVPFSKAADAEPSFLDIRVSSINLGRSGGKEVGTRVYL